MRAPDKHRFLNAAQHIEQSEIPYFEIETDTALVQRMLGRNLDMRLHSFELPVDDVMALHRLLGTDMVYFSHVWHLGRKEWADAEGRLHYAGGRIKTRGDLPGITYPDLGALRRRLDRLCALAEREGFGVVYGTQTAGHTANTAIGYEDFCVNAIDDPGFILELQKHVQDYAMRELEAFLEFPIDVVKVGIGLVTNSGPMLSPAMMETFEFDHLRQLIRRAKDAGCMVLMHVDGVVASLLPMFIEMGVDVLHPIDPSAGRQSIYEIKRLYGDKLALCGNIDVDGVLYKGTPEDVKRDVHEHITRLATGGGYIVGSSHDLHQLLPLENIYALRDAVHEYRFDGRAGKASHRGSPESSR